MPLKSEKSNDTVSAVPRPAQTTFPKGRMATKEAWNYCKSLCQEKGLKVPTLKTFKWHLRQGEYLKADRVPNPFGRGGPKKVYSLSCEAVIAFVAEIEKDPKRFEVVEQTPRSAPPGFFSAAVEQSSSEKRLSGSEAFQYLQQNATGRCQLTADTFQHYLTYDVIPSRWVEKDGELRRQIEVGDLEAFLDLAPDGNYAKQLDYRVALSRGPDDLSIKEAFDYYASVDPEPISLTDFREVVAAGILPAIRTTNSIRAPIVGIRRQDVNAFLAMRHRLELERQQGAEARAREKEEKEKSAARTALVAKTMKKAFEKALPASKPAMSPSSENTERVLSKPSADARWEPTKKAYAYYEQKASRPLTYSWFREKVYQGKFFTVKTVEDKRFNNPSGKKCYVDLNSIDAYLAQDPKTKATPQKAWPVEKAYYKFSQVIPPGFSLLQFKKLVNTGLIRSFTRNSVVHVRMDAVESYFAGLAEEEEVFSPYARIRLEGAPEKSSDEDVAEERASSEPLSAPKGIVSLSLSDYASHDEMTQVLELLTSQGFKVQVKP